jgi:hypothetical protein
MSGNGKDDFNRLRAQFSRRANAPKIPALASKLCWWIAYGHMDLKRRSTFVSQITLANDLGGVTVRSVQRMIDILKPLGLNVAAGHGPNRANTYWIGEADNTTSMSPIEADNRTSMSPIQPGQSDITGTNRRHYRREKATPVSPLLKKVSKKDTKERGEAAARTSDDDRESLTETAPLEPLIPPERAAEDGAPRDLLDDDDHHRDRSSPPIATPIGAAPLMSSAQAAFADVRYAWPTDRTDDEGYAAYVAALAAAQGDTDVVLDAIWDRLEESGADPPWLSDALRHIEHDLRYGNSDRQQT